MFGYVRARQDTLTDEDRSGYEGAYCGLCHVMGERYGPFARLFLNYDFAFLAMALAPAQDRAETQCRTCLRHPIKGKSACRSSAWLETAAGESVILTWWKLRDTVADGGPLRSLGARLLCLLLGPGYRRARAHFPDFDREAASLLAQLGELEREGCPSLDRTAHLFARLLCLAVPPTGDRGRDRVLEQLFYHLGRWIYLIDAVDDLEEDRRKGRYNPVLARFPQWTAEEKDYLRTLLDRSLDRMGAAFQLLSPGPFRGVLENILYSGLPGVEELVFKGEWRRAPKTKRKGADAP